MGKRDTVRGIQSIQHAFDILEYIHSNDGARLAELSESLALARSTVHNHLTTLKQMGYLIKEANTYHLSLQFLHLGEYTRRRKPEYSLAHRAVEQLAQETNEEVDFTVPENGRMISLYHSVGDQRSSGLQVGQWFHMHTTAAGKAVMAEMTQTQIEDIVETWGLPAQTDNTITEIDELHDELETVRERGYAINSQETLDGYQAVGVSANYPNGDVFGALTVGGPIYRIESAIESSNILDNLFDTVREVERGLDDGTDAERNWWRKDQ